MENIGLNKVNREEVKPRIEFIDLAKGVVILLVVMLHTFVVGPDVPWGGMRMPLYFVLSGLFFKDYGSMWQLLVRKINKLIVPCVFFFMLAISLYRLPYLLKGVSQDHLQYSYTSIFRGDVSWNYPIWFLMCLFWDNMLFGVITRCIQRRWIIVLTTVVMCSVGFYVDAVYKGDTYYFVSALISIPFFGLGYLLRRTDLLVAGKQSLREFLAACLVFAVGFGVAWYYGNPHYSYLYHLMAGNVAIWFITSLAMVFGCLLICKRVKRIWGLSYMGRYSIMILGMHFIVIHFMCNKIKLATFMEQDLAMFIISLVVSAAAIEPLRRLAPWFTAQRDLFALRDGRIIWLPQDTELKSKLMQGAGWMRQKVSLKSK